MSDFKSHIQRGFVEIQQDGIAMSAVPSFAPYVDYVLCAKEQGLGFKTIRGINKEQMQRSYQRLCRAAQMPYERAVMTNIVHQNTVYPVEQSVAGFGISRESSLPPCDGLMSNVPGLPLATTHADCLPIAYYDKKNNVGAVIHAGWRGVLQSIHLTALEQMKASYASAPENILIALGPFICPGCFEVGKQVSRQFQETFGKGEYVIPAEQKDHLDLGGLVLQGWERAGVLPEHITLDGRCTAHHQLPSYRRDREQAGTMVQMMMLRE